MNTEMDERIAGNAFLFESDFINTRKKSHVNNDLFGRLFVLRTTELA